MKKNWSKERIRQIFWSVFWTILIGLLDLSMITPFLWMLSASMKRSLDVMKLPIEWIPKYFYPDNYMKVWNIGGKGARDYHFGLAYFNSLKIAFINLAGSVITSTLAGYAFAKIEFKGRNVLFLLYLATMMIPSQITLIPKFAMFNKMGLTGTHLTLILPLVFLSDWRLYTIPLALTNFIEESVTEYNLVMAAASSALIPAFIVFIAGQKFLVKGLVTGAVKG